MFLGHPPLPSTPEQFDGVDTMLASICALWPGVPRPMGIPFVASFREASANRRVPPPPRLGEGTESAEWYMR